MRRLGWIVAVTLLAALAALLVVNIYIADLSAVLFSKV